LRLGSLKFSGLFELHPSRSVSDLKVNNSNWLTVLAFSLFSAFWTLPSAKQQGFTLPDTQGFFASDHAVKSLRRTRTFEFKSSQICYWLSLVEVFNEFAHAWSQLKPLNSTPSVWAWEFNECDALPKKNFRCTKLPLTSLREYAAARVFSLCRTYILGLNKHSQVFRCVNYFHVAPVPFDFFKRLCFAGGRSSL